MSCVYTSRCLLFLRMKRWELGEVIFGLTKSQFKVHWFICYVHWFISTVIVEWLDICGSLFFKCLIPSSSFGVIINHYFRLYNGQPFVAD